MLHSAAGLFARDVVQFAHALTHWITSASVCFELVVLLALHFDDLDLHLHRLQSATAALFARDVWQLVHFFDSTSVG